MDSTGEATADGAPGEGLHLTLRYPWPAAGSDETALSTLIPRIQAQRGHFRDVNEAILQSEIASAAGDSSPDAAGTAGAEAEAAAAPLDRSTQLTAAKLEIQRWVFTAHLEARKALDYLSLLVSLHAPQPGLSSLSPDLRGSVPAGALGVDWITRRADARAEKEEAAIARAWKVDALNSAADSLLAASRKLGSEVQKESKYWGEVLAIRDEGWLVTRMPRQRDTLGVRYGFAEAAPEFKNKGIGALRRGEDGGVVMDDVETGSRGKAMLRVRVFRNGECVSESVQSAGGAGGDGRGVKDMILRARNFIYEEELFFEIMREARVMASQGIRTSSDAVTIELAEGHRVVLDMAPLDADPAPAPPTLAQGLATALRILLSYNHRLTLAKRSRPPPPLTMRTHATPPLYLIRPITTHLYHARDLSLLRSHLASLHKILQTAGLAVSYTLTPLLSARGAIGSVEDAVGKFLGTQESRWTLRLPGGWEVAGVLRTGLAPPWWGSGWTVGVHHDGQAARLLGERTFAGWAEVARYVRWCVKRAVVNELRMAGWSQEAGGDEVSRAVKEGAEAGAGRVRVRVGVDEAGLGVEVVGGGGGGGGGGRFVWDGSERAVGLAGWLDGTGEMKVQAGYVDL